MYSYVSLHCKVYVYSNIFISIYSYTRMVWFIMRKNFLIDSRRGRHMDTAHCVRNRIRDCVSEFNKNLKFGLGRRSHVANGV